MTRMQGRQKPYVQRLLSLSEGLPVARVPLTLEEIRGLAPLWALGEDLLGQLRVPIPGKESAP
jgi:hypothetical protein